MVPGRSSGLMKRHLVKAFIILMDINLQSWTSVFSNSVFIVSAISRCPHKTARLFPKLLADFLPLPAHTMLELAGKRLDTRSKVVGWEEGLGTCELTKALETNANKNVPKTLSRIVGYNVSSKVTDKCVACRCECNFFFIIPCLSFFLFPLFFSQIFGSFWNQKVYKAGLWSSDRRGGF